MDRHNQDSSDRQQLLYQGNQVTSSNYENWYTPQRARTFPSEETVIKDEENIDGNFNNSFSERDTGEDDNNYELCSYNRTDRFREDELTHETEISWLDFDSRDGIDECNRVHSLRSNSDDEVTYVDERCRRDNWDLEETFFMYDNCHPHGNQTTTSVRHHINLNNPRSSFRQKERFTNDFFPSNFDLRNKELRAFSVPRSEHDKNASHERGNRSAISEHTQDQSRRGNIAAYGVKSVQCRVAEQNDVDGGYNVLLLDKHPGVFKTALWKNETEMDNGNKMDRDHNDNDNEKDFNNSKIMNTSNSNVESETSPTSSGSPGSDTSSKRKKKKKKRRGWIEKVWKSSHDEERLLKIVVWFPIGVALSALLYFLTLRKMRMRDQSKALIGGVLGLLLSFTFALSVQMRCVLCLVVPTFVGKAGRSYIAAFAIIYLIEGPITNIMDNSKEVVRSLTCTSALLANHSKAKWKLRLHPIEGAIGDIQKEGFFLSKVGRRIEKAFAPLKKEIRDRTENKELEEDIKKAEKVTNSKENVVDKIERSYKTEESKEDAGKRVEREWKKKMVLRCEDTFSRGILRCREKMRELERKCLSAIPIIGYLLCLPLKITVFCNILKLIPGAIGADCEHMDVIDPGFGDTYVSAQAMIDDMNKGLQVRMQYEVVGDPEKFDYTEVEHLRKATLHEVDQKIKVVDFLFNVISYILTFTFLIIFRSAYVYNSKYLTDIKFDNNFVTHYFRHIDARRRANDKRTLLPLKRFERKDYIFPGKMGLTKSEKQKLGKGTAKLILRVIVCAIICYMDNLMYEILNIIARNSRVEYHQEGEHVVDIKRQFPVMCKCLSVFKSAKETCIVCEEKEGDDFYFCDTAGCGIAYCASCWKDIGKKCYACSERIDSDSEDETEEDDVEEDDDL